MLRRDCCRRILSPPPRLPRALPVQAPPPGSSLANEHRRHNSSRRLPDLPGLFPCEHRLRNSISPLNGIDPRRQLPRPAARSCSLPGRPRLVVLAAHPASCSPLTRPVLSASPLHKPTAARRCGAVPREGSGAARWRAVKPARGRDGRARSGGYPSRNGGKRTWNGRSTTWNAATRARYRAYWRRPRLGTVPSTGRLVVIG